jgi:RNase adaptor protein for sRNA GlmZ degradation
VEWILFQYNVPNKPSKLRVYVWRKLKAIRAEALTEGVYALPLMDKTREQLEWLCAEVKEMKGTAALWKAVCFSENQEQELIERFQLKAGKDYERIQESLLKKVESEQELWLDSIIREYANIRYHDYFNTQEKHTIHTQIERQYLKSKRRKKS